MIGVPSSTLTKQGPLTPAELDEIREHPWLGERIVAPVPALGGTARQVIACHHERWDGLGYPRGLRGAEIPLAARIFAVADTFDAMTNDQPYREAMTAQGGTRRDPCGGRAASSIRTWSRLSSRSSFPSSRSSRNRRGQPASRCERSSSRRPQLVDPAVQLAPLVRELPLAKLEVRPGLVVGKHRDAVVQPPPRGGDVAFLGLELLEQLLDLALGQIVHVTSIGRARPNDQKMSTDHPARHSSRGRMRPTISLEHMSVLSPTDQTDADAHDVPRKPLGTLLVEAGFIDDGQLAEALHDGTQTGERVGEVVVRRGWASEDDVAQLLAAQWELTYVDRASIWFDASALSRLSREDAQHLEALPIRLEGDRVMVAVAEPTEQRLAELRRLIGDDAVVVVVPKSALDAGIRSQLLTSRGPSAEESHAHEEPNVDEPWTDEPAREEPALPEEPAIFEAPPSVEPPRRAAPPESEEPRVAAAPPRVGSRSARGHGPVRPRGARSRHRGLHRRPGGRDAGVRPAHRRARGGACEESSGDGGGEDAARRSPAARRRAEAVGLAAAPRDEGPVRTPDADHRACDRALDAIGAVRCSAHGNARREGRVVAPQVARRHP